MESPAAKAKLKARPAHPQESNNCISNLFYCWTFPIFRKGMKKQINESDLYQVLEEHEAGNLAKNLEKEWKKHKHKSLWKAIFMQYKWDILIFGFYTIFIEIIFPLIPPIALAHLMNAYGSTDKETGISTAKIVNASIIVSLSFLKTLVHHKYVLHFLELGMRIRIACSSLIYKKCLKLNRSALSSTTIGHIINLLSNDVMKIVYLCEYIHVFWYAPLGFILSIYLLYSMAGVQSLAGVTFILFFMPIQLFMSKKTSYYRLRIALRTDERIKFMNEIIQGIQVIKMYAWENPFIQLIDNIRRKEIVMIKMANYLSSLMNAFSFFVDRGGIFLSILAYVLTGNSPNAHYVYVVTTLYAYLMEQVSYALPEAVSLALQSRVSIKRFSNFLALGELQHGIKPASKIGLKTDKVCARWIEDSSKNDLEMIDFETVSEGIVAIIGPIGAGKSSLLHLFLNELTITSGSVEIGGTISYASQEPWLFAGTIRQNIVFCEEYQAAKYRQVIRVCALENDLAHFPHADQTLVGEKGVLLSGGQKARINLARAIYKDADIYLLDDPLSAVDASVGKQIFNDCLCDYLKHKRTVLVTHQIQYLTSTQCIYLIENGQVSVSGTYQELRASERKFAKLLKAEEETQEMEAKESVKMDVNLDDGMEEEDFAETTQAGKISSKVYKTYLRSGGNWFSFAVISVLCVFAEVLGTGSDYFVVFWVNLEETRMAANSTILLNEFEWFFKRDICIYFYTAIIAILVIVVISRSLAYIKCCMRASVALHNKMFSAVIYTTMQFFQRNPSGRILNRFAKDIGTLDDSLPEVSMDFIRLLFAVIGTSIAICLVSPWITLPSIFILIIMYFLKNIFLSSSRNIKRMEGATRSPIFGHITETMKGLGTLRAVNAEHVLEKEFYNHLNTNTSAFFMFLGCNRSFAFWLDSICNVYSAMATIIALVNEQYGGNVGFIITQSMSLTGMFQWTIRQWGELENQMTSVERVLEYSDLQREPDCGQQVSSGLVWPKVGRIEFDSVFLKYNKEDPYVLKNLTFSISPGEKIGIVGRTGAGKSSLISLLFRLVAFEGNIYIDGLNTKEISLTTLRSKLGIIPQDPVLFSATIRKNLDPFEEFSDEQIWKALEEVELKEFVVNLAAGINSVLAETGSNLSVGQKQLLCLARALLKNNHILIMDEATANVDPHTDELLQKTIRKNFGHCTVLTIAHRLHTIMDADKVLVMREGKVVEFDHPYNLLRTGKGYFYDLVNETGRGTANNLIEISKMNYPIN